ncbi:MAG: hypothetical protein PHE93_05330 [Clostridia bacterium]|nr:hypothetical protein [Clostridia bacterium]
MNREDEEKSAKFYLSSEDKVGYGLVVKSDAEGTLLHMSIIAAAFEQVAYFHYTLADDGMQNQNSTLEE